MNRQPIQRKTPMKRGKPLRRVSKKRAAENKTYAKQRAEFLAKHLHCEICIAMCLFVGEMRPPSDVHHQNGRNGRRLLDEAYWLAVCREHHQWIHDNPKEARQRGWLI